MASSSFGVLLDKLRVPHPTVQRYAVRSIFDTLKVGPPHLGLQSQAGQQALSECLLLASRCLPALDEAVSQLCDLLQQGEEAPLVLAHLQAALECAPAEAVPMIVRSIGFVCRHLLSNHSSILQGFQAYELHPFVKAFTSRRETHLEIVQQVLIMFMQDGFMKDSECLRFLQPVLNYVLLHPWAHGENFLVARELHFGLASLISSNFAVGRLLIRLLVYFISHYSLQTAQESDRTVTALRELVDVLESFAMQASVEAEIDDCKKIVGNVLVLLVETCHKLKEQGFSLLPILELLGRVVKLQKSLDDTVFWRWKVLSLAHLLAMTDLKEEQLALICLAKNVLRKSDQNGMDVLIDSMHAFPVALLWVFPTVNLMASSCTFLKETATSLLQDLEDFLGFYWTQKESDVPLQTIDFNTATSHGQLADNMHNILFYLWFDGGPCKTWISLKSTADWVDFKNQESEGWLQRLSTYLEKIFQSHSSKVSKFSKSEAYQNSGLIIWICMVVSVVLIHPVNNIFATEVIAGIGKFDSIKGFSLVPVVLFYLKALRRHWKKARAENLFGLLKLLPSLAVHPMSSSVVVGTLEPLLHSKCSRVLQATAIRLLCKSWEVSNKVFPYLQAALDHTHLLEPVTDFQISLSRAVSICDVCKRDADSGVELILSIQVCIESKSLPIKALGLQSLAWLCQYDVIDFYTAWDVISSLFSGFPSDPLLAESLCFFLQNGALDAAAYSDSAYIILQFLWKAATIPDAEDELDCKWWTVREKALKALSSYEVDDLNISLGDDRGRQVKILLSEVKPEVLRACEKLVIKFLHHEFKFRRRGQEDVKHMDSKVGKVITAIPRALSASVQNGSFSMQSPAAYLLLKFFHQQGRLGLQSSKVKAKNTLQSLQEWEANFEQQFFEISDHINLQGNVILALLYLDPWFPFIMEWLKERRSIHNASDTPINLENTAALHLMKLLCRISEEAIPRVAENAVLSLAVLYRCFQVSQETPDNLAASIVEYLKSRLVQNGHEYLQWTSAVALGVVGRYCNAAEWRLKSDISKCLIECLSKSDRDIVRGACGMALGFLCQNLVSQDGKCEPGADLAGTVQERELSIHAFVFENILNLLSIWCPETFEVLQKIGRHTLESSGNKLKNLCSPQIKSSSESGKECIWTVAGLAMAIGSSVVALERIGAPKSISHVTEFLIQGIHTFHSGPDKDCFFSLAIGSFISLPTCIETCLRLGILREEVDTLLQNEKDFLVLCKSDKYFPAELRMAACIGSGNLLATLLHHGTHKLTLEDIHSIIESLKSVALGKNCALSSLGGFIGLANALGAGTALVVPPRQHRLDMLKTMPSMDGGMEASTVCTPLLYESSCQGLVQNLVQDLLRSSLQASDASSMSSACWALALIRKAFIKENDAEHKEYGDVSSSIHTKISLTSLPKESSLYILCSWLLDIQKKLVNSRFPYFTVASVLRCLKEAPQLPFLDWGTLMRQFLHQMTSSLEFVDKNYQYVVMQDELCKECILFTLAHARRLPNLQTFLNELCDLSRLISMRTSVSSVLILHMAELSSIFSRSQMEKFFLDSVELTCRGCTLQDSECSFSSNASWQLKISFWKGLKCLILQLSKDSEQYMDKDKLFLGAEKCLDLLDVPSIDSENSNLVFEEWSGALECMLQASKEWIMKVTEFDWKGAPTTKEDVISAQKAVFIMSQMVIKGSLPPSALTKPIRWFCNQEASKVFPQLLWITSALKEVSLEEKQQCLIEAIETACLLENPETGLLFFALLTSSWCSYAPLILVDSQTILKLLPFTLKLLLSEEGWRFTSKAVLQKSMALLEKFADHIRTRDSALFYVKQACMAMRKDLSLADQLRLVDDLEAVLPL